MARRKKKQDKLIAGFLALLTAFSPVASVVPVYAADMNDTGSSSITMDPDSITIDETGLDGIVLDGSDEGSDGITVIDGNDNDNQSEGGISIGDDSQNGDGIQIDNTGNPDDGINIDDPDDGIDIQEPDSDGIDIDKTDDGITIGDISAGDTVDGITIDSITKAGDGIIIESTDENGEKSITADPWGGETPENAISVPTMYELSIDIRSSHGVVKLTPADADESDLSQVKYIRVVESDDGYDIVVTDGDGNVVYEAPYEELYGFAWSEFIAPDASYTVEAIADDDYVVTDYSIVNPRKIDEIADFNDFKSGVYSSYSWTLGNLKNDRAVVVNFGSGDGIDVVESENESHELVDASDVMASVEMVDDSVIETSDEDENGVDEAKFTESILESEKDTLGYENIEIIPSMISDVDVPKITKSDRKEAMFDPVYEGYIKDNINSDYADFQNLIPAGGMIVKQTLFDEACLYGRTTIDDIMAFDDEAKRLAMVAQMDTMIPVYDVGDSKYYIAYVDTMHNDSRSYVTDHEFAYNNLNGEVLDDCIYDYDTGIAYINKDYFVDENGDFLLNNVQVQLGQVIRYNPQYTESVFLNGMDDDINVDSFDMFIGECTFYVDKNLDPNCMNVWLNGGPCSYDYKYDPSDGSITIQISPVLVSSVYVEDTRTVGQSILNAIFPFTIAKANEGTVTEDEMKALGEVVLKKAYEDDGVKAGDGGKETATYHYFGDIQKNLQDSNYPYPCYSFQWGSLKPDPVSKKWAEWIQDGGTKPHLNIMKNTKQGLYFLVDMDTITSKNLPFKWTNLLTDYDTLKLPMQCTHVGTYQTNAKMTSKKIGKYYYCTVKKANVWCRVIKKWKKTPGAKRTYFLLGVMTGTMNTQTGLGLVKLYYDEPIIEPDKVELQLRKIFNNTMSVFDVGDDENDDNYLSYDLTSTIFGIYDTKAHAKNASVIDSFGKSVGVLDDVGQNGLLKKLKVRTTDGYTGVWKLHKDDINASKWLDKDDNKIPNVVYIVELKAGRGYSLPTIGEISDGTFDGNTGIGVGGIGYENRVIAVNLKDYKKYGIDDTATLFYGNSPLYDPAALTIFKTDNPDDPEKATTIEEWRESSNSEMNDAEFTLEYWNADYKDYADTISEAIPKIVNGYTASLGDNDLGDGTKLDAPTEQDMPARKPDHTFKLKTIHHKKYGDGYLSVNDDDCFMDGQYWLWRVNFGQDKVMPLGIYRLTETKAPPGYELPDDNVYYAYCYGEDDGKGGFEGHFEWLDTGINTMSYSQFPVDYGDPSYGWSAPKEGTFLIEKSPRRNIGTLKIDKSTGKPGKPDNDALSLAGIEFGIWRADDDSDGDVINPLDGKKLDKGEQFEGVTLVTDENGCADTVGLNMFGDKDMGIFTPGHKYVIKETKSNDSYFKSSSTFTFTIPKNGSSTCYFPTKDGGDAIAHEDIKSAKDAYQDYSKNKDNKDAWKLDYNKITIFENESPNIGVGVQKFDIMLDSSVRGVNGIANHGNATLEGHTFVVINGTKSDVRMNDSKKLDGKGTIVNSIWNFIEPGVLKHPYNPSYEELFNCVVDTNSVLRADGTREWFVVDNAKSGPTYGKEDDKDDKNKNTDDVDKTRGYVCAVLKTNKEGYAETVKDLLPMGVYYVIEVDTKITGEGYHDYLVNTLDVGHVGEYQPDGTDEDGNQKDKLVLEKNGKDATASNMNPDGEVFVAEFTQNLKDTEWKDVNKTHSDLRHAANKPPRGGVEFQKYNWNSDDPYATGDSDLSGFEFTIINVSDEVVQNKDGVNIPSWKTHGYTGKDQFMSLKYSQVQAIAGTYGVQKVVTELVDDPDNKYGAGGKVNMGRTGNQDLPYGDYLIIETGVPEKSGYKLNTSWIGYFEIREDGKMVQIQTVTGDDHNKDAETWRGYNGLPMKYAKDAVACRNKPVAMGIAIEKLDYEMKKPIAQGTASLKGAVYAVINASDNPVAKKDGSRVNTIQMLSGYSNDAVSYNYLYNIYKNDQRYAGSGGHVVTTLTTDKRGFASTEKDALPAGTYYVIEVKASPGYWIDENFVGKVCVRDDNICMAMTDKNNPTNNGSYFVNVNYVHGYVLEMLLLVPLCIWLCALAHICICFWRYY